ncbi:hypothetical protein Q3G72_035060 [Acer saccharum]|nr:hypothetical protein Q3G72_035060 [Acer saccharum]
MGRVTRPFSVVEQVGGGQPSHHRRSNRQRQMETRMQLRWSTDGTPYLLQMVMQLLSPALDGAVTSPAVVSGLLTPLSNPPVFAIKELYQITKTQKHLLQTEEIGWRRRPARGDRLSDLKSGYGGG